MPRNRKPRRIVAPPGFHGFRPYGNRQTSQQSIDLHYEEYEALKLADYDMKNHEEASELMGISRATFARIYESARQKIAMALVESREIKTVFGNAVMDASWFVCNSCHARFTLPESMTKNSCPLCKDTNIQAVSSLQGKSRDHSEDS